MHMSGPLPGCGCISQSDCQNQEQHNFFFFLSELYLVSLSNRPFSITSHLLNNGTIKTTPQEGASQGHQEAGTQCHSPELLQKARCCPATTIEESQGRSHQGQGGRQGDRCLILCRRQGSAFLQLEDDSSCKKTD